MDLFLAGNTLGHTIILPQNRNRVLMQTTTNWTRSAPGCTRFGSIRSLFFSIFALFLVSACGSPSSQNNFPEPDSDNGGLVLPEGFEAFVVVDSIGPARHIVVNDNGDIYVKLRRIDENGGIVALRDTTGDGRADVIKQFGHYQARANYETDVRIRDGFMYFSTNLQVFRMPMIEGELVPDTSRMELIVYDDHPHEYHAHQTKPIAFDNENNMYVAYGAPSDTCQDPPRTPGLMAQDPCPQLVDHGGIWKFSADELKQVQEESESDNPDFKKVGTKYSMGLRSVVAMEWHPVDNELYLVQHGRDYLFRQWSNIYSRWDSALLPAEEFVRASEGTDFGWPFCYYDQLKGQKLLNPEYEGDGETIGRCGEFDAPIIGFPGHFAPNDLRFYEGDQFPEHYKHGAFIAFHGSTIRAPYPQGGYFVSFVPWEDSEFSSEWEVFANGFAGVDPIVNTSDAEARPMGIAEGPDGSIYITESKNGKIWRVVYTGDRDNFGDEQLAPVIAEKENASNIKNPHPVEDNLERNIELGGETVYNTYCAACHSRNGEGSPPRFPPISDTEWVNGDKETLITIVLQGLDGAIEVKGEVYNTPMPAHGYLSDEEIAQVLTYVRSNFGNNASPVSPAEVADVRASLEE